jgi:hypothetical protein
MTAVALYEQIARDDLDLESCVAWITAQAPNFEGLGIPNIIVREVREKVLSIQNRLGLGSN